ncbi:peptidase domain-containing ABC transporter [Chitinophaga vietnamensis]|uniref:peptidase domain-containing ABC transporter n=1 Tax=Chitinophaga vietnamensis TaxID=2593957 RepID=UPI00191C43F7|nr:peptidase domain-containing ABC transporter [Chitinophaga vietnamensis]
MKPFIITQQDQSDCGVACLSTIITFYGGSVSMETLRRNSGTSRSGTTLLGLFQAAKDCGFISNSYVASVDALKEQLAPVILHVVIDGHLQHYVVCFGTRKEKDGGYTFIIGDPSSGMVYMPAEKLDAIWRSKVCLTLEPDNDKFRKVKDIRSEKVRWIRNLLTDDIAILSIAAGIGVGIAVLGLSMAIFSQRLIDDILPGKKVDKLIPGILLLFFVLIAKEVLAFFRQYFLISQSKGFNTRITDIFYSRLLHLPKPFFDSRKVGELTARLNDTTRIQRVISQLAGNTLIDVLVVIVTTGFLFSYSISMGVLCIVILPTFYFIVYLHNRPILEGQKKTMVDYANTESNYISTLQGIDPIKNHNLQQMFASVNKTIYQRYQESIFKLGKIQIRLSFLANSLGVLFLVGVLFYGSKLVLADRLKTGELIAILSMYGTLLPCIANLALISIPLSEAKIAFDRMFEFTSISPEKDEETELAIEQLISLKVEQLSFRFAGRSQILKSVSFEVNRSEIIAIMGENGCGKSTLGQVLLKHYFPEHGTIMINERYSFGDIKLDKWRSLCALVPQSIHLFNGTVLENIAFEDAVTKTQEVIFFLQQYGFAPFLDSLPQSVMTLIGEEGVSLSGGQKQMIALARALYRKPQLLVLDEATAAMDREHERFVLRLLQRLKQEMAIVFITHRLHVLKAFCDRIYILEKGTITAAGSHDTLLKTDNLYSIYWTDMVS